MSYGGSRRERPKGEAGRSGLNRKCQKQFGSMGCKALFFAVGGMKGTGQSNEEEGRLSSVACSHIRAGPVERSGSCALGDHPKMGQLGEDHRNCSRGVFKLKTRGEKHKENE